MKKNTFEEVETLLEHYPKVLTLRLYGDGASEETVKEAEQILNVTFPEDYRKFLKKWGYLYLKDISEWIYGIAFDDIKERRENAIIETIELREWSALPEYFVAFYSDEGERYWCIDTRNPDGPVIIWNPFEKCLADKREGIGEQWYAPGIPFVDLLYGQVELSIQKLENSES